jgi:hypothetical protein
MTVWIYVDTSKDVGDVDHLKVFASPEADARCFEENDPEGVAFEWSKPPPGASAAVQTGPAKRPSPFGNRFFIALYCCRSSGAQVHTRKPPARWISSHSASCDPAHILKPLAPLTW